MTAGYSGTPLAGKLGIAAGTRVCPLFAPSDYRELVAPWPDGATLAARADPKTVLLLGWVDVKVCAVDAVGSGLKLVVRRELRASTRR